VDKIAGAGKLAQDSRDALAKTGKPEKTVGTVHPGQETLYKTARIGQQGQDS
jgi:hypothetical protein